MHHNRLSIFIISLCLILAGLVGCQSTATLYRGKTVAAEHVIPIPGGVEKESWSTDDLTISYGYQENDNNFHINGEVVLADQYKAIYHKLSRLDIYLVFINADSQVIKMARLLRNLNYSLDETITFDNRLIIPQGAVAFSFAYDATAVEFGKDGNMISFWNHPE